VTTAPANRLVDATSPYLLQHAHNPVDWYPWGSEALERARREQKPILLSIGYAACHWCHVMERESFEDGEIARVMNEHFVCVKVDREERPDLDAIYMDAVQAMTGHGGWPMTLFLTPEGEPFFAGTYYPPEDRHGLPGFRRVMESVADAWRNQRDDVRHQAGRVVDAISRSVALQASPEPLSEEILQQAHAGLAQSFDPEWGGFGAAPKFPQAMVIEFLLRCQLRGYARALEMATSTLDAMATGGLYDQLGGGFHRYSTDQRWLVPHFEKMLYDNAQLARVYLHAWQVTGKELYRRVTVETLDYLLREMRNGDGGFLSSQDADSEGVEGKFYLWPYEELVRESGARGELVAAWFGAAAEGNWEGTNVLWTPRSPERVSTEEGIGVEELESVVGRARTRLFQAREKRVKPAVDDKVLTAWNGLAITALAEAGRVLGEPRYVQAAVGAGQFVLESLRRQDGRLLRAWRDGRTSGPAYADDYGMFAAACLSLYETTFDTRWAEEARRLGDELLRIFHDRDRGGFFQTGSDAESLVVRPKELYDGAVPSGNSVAAEILQRLALLTAESDYERAGISALRLVRRAMAASPTGFGHALSALDLYLSTPQEVAIVGSPEAAETRELVREVWSRYLPNSVLAVGDPKNADAARVVPLLADRPALNGKPAAYVCERFVCRQPVTEPGVLGAQLG
jgi:uncharacterized protein